MGIIRLFTNLIGATEPEKKIVQPKKIYNDYDIHSHEDIKLALEKLEETDRQKVVSAIQATDQWGNPLSNQFINDAIRNKHGAEFAEEIKAKILDKETKDLSAERIRRNIRLYNYQEEKEGGLYFVNKKSLKSVFDKPKEAVKESKISFNSKRPPV
ncbi:MAG: hypothetical protein PHR00_04335 [Patescibacteria group bacterium]|nr:hypothetical protein [Patescibacteria group bacterium]